MYQLHTESLGMDMVTLDKHSNQGRTLGSTNLGYSCIGKPTRKTKNKSEMQKRHKMTRDSLQVVFSTNIINLAFI